MGGSSIVGLSSPVHVACVGGGALLLPSRAMAPLIEVLVCTLLLLPLNGFYCFKPIKMDMAEMGQRKSIGDKSEYENKVLSQSQME